MRIEYGFACKDYCLDRMVPSDLRKLVRERDIAEQRLRELELAAQAVIDRWDSPSWKDLPPTRDAIERLRAALEPTR